uniref:Uncharacterized protein n=1 Tax=Arundo donax TaxID=35708 RepID=A0A0A9CDE4_ARUDO
MQRLASSHEQFPDTAAATFKHACLLLLCCSPLLLAHSLGVVAGHSFSQLFILLALPRGTPVRRPRSTPTSSSMTLRTTRSTLVRRPRTLRRRTT